MEDIMIFPNQGCERV